MHFKILYTFTLNINTLKDMECLKLVAIRSSWHIVKYCVNITIIKCHIIIRSINYSKGDSL